MQKKLSLSTIVILLVLTVFAQNPLSSDFDSPTSISLEQTCIYSNYIYDQHSGNDLDIPRCHRMYPGASSWFTFTVPSNGRATVRLQFPDETLFGIAFYYFEYGEYQEIKCDVFRGTDGALILYPNEQYENSDILVRFWKLGDADSGSVNVCISGEDVPQFAKVLSVDVASYTPQQLVQDVLITGCLTAENIVYTGHAESIGYFSNGIPGLDFEEGVILSSGYVTDAEGPNTSGSTGEDMLMSGDSDLNNIALGTTQDAAVLEFDFVPASDVIEFEYVFGSDEYLEWANSSYNDAFGFFVSGGPEGYTNENIALIPGTSTPVTINNINDVNNPSYYVDNETSPNIEYDGMTVTLIATVPVTACETYHIKLAVADVGDASYDSAVFLKANSFTSGESYIVETFNSWSNALEVMRGCSNYIVFSRTDETPLTESVPIELTVGGTATSGVDYSAVPESLEIPIGEDSIVVYFDAYDLGVPQGDETIILTFENGCPCDAGTTQHTITIIDAFEVDPEIANDSPICVGDDATLTVTLNTPDPDNVTIEWNTGEIDVDQIIVSPEETTNYSVDIIYPCDTITLTTTVTVIEPPDVDLGPDIDVASLNTNLDAGMATGNTGVWTSTGGPGTANINPADASITTVSVDDFGIYNFTWTETSLAPNCVSSDDINVNFYHIPTADFEATEILCFGDYTTITFTGDIIDGLATFDWDFGTANVISGTDEGPYVIEFTESGTFNISLTVTEDIATADYDIDIVVPPPLDGTLTAYDDPCFESCNGNAIIEMTGGIAPYNYSWASTSNEIDNLCLGDYGLTVTDVNGCEYATTFSISQPPLLEYNTNYNHVDCYGGFTGNASIMPYGGTEPYTYIWNDGFNMANHNNIQAGDYMPTVIDANGCSVTELFVITEPDLLQVVTSGDFEICENQTVNIAAQPMGGTLPYTFFWDSGDGNGFVEGDQTFQVIPHEDITYTVYVEDDHGCTSNLATTDITVSPTIYLDLETEDNTCFESCDGSALINITGGLQPFEYSWESNGPLYDDLCADIYTLTITDQIGCTADTMFIIEQPLELELTMNVEDAPCSYSDEGSASVVINGGTPPYNYLWETGNTTNELLAPLGIYDITVSDDHNCRVYGTANIDAPEDLIVLPLYNSTICLGGDANVIAQASGGTPYYHFHWQGTDESEYWEHQFTTSPEESTTYYLTVTDDNGCTSTGYSVNVNVLPPLSINHIINSVDNVCAGHGTSIELDISGGNGGPYQITIPDNESQEIVASPFMYYPEETTNLVFTVEDMCETPAVSDSIMIYVHDNPFVDFTTDINEGCPHQNIAFYSLDTLEDCDYIWDFGDNIFGFSRNPVHTYNQNGNFDVQLTIIDQFGCTNTIKKDSLIEIFPQPYANFAAEPEIASILNPQIKFNNYSEEALFYFWYYGDGDSTINFRSPVHFFDNMGEYEVMLVSENEYGCTDTVRRNVLIQEEYTVWAPTAFTPNGDGINDCFRLCGNGIDHHTFNMLIYNRWGELVFSTDKYNKDFDCKTCGDGSWDGTKGSHLAGDKYLPNGIYYWYAKFLDNDGIGHDSQGVIQLIR